MTSTLPKPSPNQAYIDVSALDAGMLDLPHRITMADSSEHEVSFCPSLAFYLKHSTKDEPFVFDLGIRRDTKSLPPFAQHQINTDFAVKVPQDIAESLVKGGVQPEDVKTVLISHLHWDHIGDSSPFKNATFFLGTDAKAALAEGYPTDPNSGVLSTAFPSDRTHFFAESEFNVSVGPFPRAIDYYKDGSLYIIDASGHMPGHINILARTSPNGSWIFLAADTAHDVRLLSGEKQVGTKFGCMHGNLKVAQVHIDRTAQLWRDPSVHVLIAHDWEWYQNNKGTDVFFPGKIRLECVCSLCSRRSSILYPPVVSEQSSLGLIAGYLPNSRNLLFSHMMTNLFFPRDCHRRCKSAQVRKAGHALFLKSPSVWTSLYLSCSG